MFGWFSKFKTSKGSEAKEKVKDNASASENNPYTKTNKTGALKRGSQSPNNRARLKKKDSVNESSDNEFGELESFRKRASSAKKEHVTESNNTEKVPSPRTPPSAPLDKKQSSTRPSSRSGTPNSSSHKLGAIYFKNTLLENRRHTRRPSGSVSDMPTDFISNSHSTDYGSVISEDPDPANAEEKYFESELLLDHGAFQHQRDENKQTTARDENKQTADIAALSSPSLIPKELMQEKATSSGNRSPSPSSPDKEKEKEEEIEIEIEIEIETEKETVKEIENERERKGENEKEGETEKEIEIEIKKEKEAEKSVVKTVPPLPAFTIPDVPVKLTEAVVEVEAEVEAVVEVEAEVE